MTKEIMVERQESLIPVSEIAYLRGEVNRLREGNVKLLKEAAHEREGYETAIALSGVCDRLRDELAAARKWYDEVYPFDDGRDKVYPWD